MDEGKQETERPQAQP